jgi:hypothetical protein
VSAAAQTASHDRGARCAAAVVTDALLHCESGGDPRVGVVGAEQRSVALPPGAQFVTDEDDGEHDRAGGDPDQEADQLEGAEAS